MRNALRPLRSIAVLGAFVAAAALVVLPAAHPAHAPHAPLATSLAAAPAPAFAAVAHDESAGCSLCALVGQARTIVASPAIALAKAFETAPAVALARIEAPPALDSPATLAPRAPPVRI